MLEAHSVVHSMLNEMMVEDSFMDRIIALAHSQMKEGSLAAYL